MELIADIISFLATPFLWVIYLIIPYTFIFLSFKFLKLQTIQKREKILFLLIVMLFDATLSAYSFTIVKTHAPNFYNDYLVILVSALLYALVVFLLVRFYLLVDKKKLVQFLISVLSIKGIWILVTSVLLTLLFPNLG